ncbi:MAG: hypothetical protein PHR16_11860 [Methylovulum sp.]|nr:hypothetical protein [Methylovulum sp.]
MLVFCDNCNGIGQCPMCNGTGIDSELDERCGCCFGSGECPECGGAGELDDAEL